jgi:hypothetical protein
LPSRGHRQLAYGNGVFVTPGYSSSAAMVSTNAVAWTENTLPSSSNWSGIAYGNGVFSINPYYATNSATSTDGITWTTRTLPTSGRYTKMTYAG